MIDVYPTSALYLHTHFLSSNVQVIFLMGAVVSGLAAEAAVSAVGATVEKVGSAAAKWAWAKGRSAGDNVRKSVVSNKRISTIVLLGVIVAALICALVGQGMMYRASRNEVMVLKVKPDMPLLLISKVNLQFLSEDEFFFSILMCPVMRTTGLDYFFSDVVATAQFDSQLQTFKNFGRTIAQWNERKMWEGTFQFRGFLLSAATQMNATTGTTSLPINMNVSARLEWQTEDKRLSGQMPFRANCPITLGVQPTTNVSSFELGAICIA